MITGLEQENQALRTELAMLEEQVRRFSEKQSNFDKVTRCECDWQKRTIVCRAGSKRYCFAA